MVKNFISLGLVFLTSACVHSAQVIREDVQFWSEDFPKAEDYFEPQYAGTTGTLLMIHESKEHCVLKGYDDWMRHEPSYAIATKCQQGLTLIDAQRF